MNAEADARAFFAAEGIHPHGWSNEAGYFYAAHQHHYYKVLMCTAGSITFHLPDGDVVLHAGERLDVPPGTEHSATVGPNGVTCWEAPRP